MSNALDVTPTPLPLQSGGAAAAEPQSPPGIQGGRGNAVPLAFRISDKPLGISDTSALAKKKYRAEPEVFSLYFWLLFCYLEHHTPPVLLQVLTSVGSHCLTYKYAKCARSS